MEVCTIICGPSTYLSAKVHVDFLSHWRATTKKLIVAYIIGQRNGSDLTASRRGAYALAYCDTWDWYNNKDELRRVDHRQCCGQCARSAWRGEVTLESGMIWLLLHSTFVVLLFKAKSRCNVTYHIKHPIQIKQPWLSKAQTSSRLHLIDSPRLVQVPARRT